MKKALATTMLLLAVNCIFAQQFSLSVLVNMVKMNWSDFDNIVSSKGFSYEHLKNEKTTELECRGYINNANETITKTIMFVTRYSKYEVNSVAYFLNNKAQYLHLKGQASFLGFKFHHSSTQVNDEMSFIYEKGDYVLKFYTYSNKYCILVSKDYAYVHDVGK